MQYPKKKKKKEIEIHHFSLEICIWQYEIVFSFKMMASPLITNALNLNACPHTPTALLSQTWFYTWKQKTLYLYGTKTLFLFQLSNTILIKQVFSFKKIWLDVEPMTLQLF